MTEVNAQVLDAAVRHAEAAERHEGTTRKALERIAAGYFWKAVGTRHQTCDRASRQYG